MLYVTGNSGKFREAQVVLDSIHLVQRDLDIPEIQGEIEDIIVDKASRAFATLDMPLIVEDVSFSLRGLGGFPGPYIKSFLQGIGESGLWELVDKLGDDQCSTSCFAAHVDQHGKVTVASGSIEGRVVKPRGSLMHGKVSYNACFLPNGAKQTFGEMSMQQHAEISHRAVALRALAKKVTIN